MGYKIMILAPSAGGKSTLMRFLRENTDLRIAETDEEVMNANKGQWPSDNHKYKSLARQTTFELISQDNVVCLLKDTPNDLVLKARNDGFKIVVLQFTLNQLADRNSKRMKEEGYDDASEWFKDQLEHLQNLSREKMIDEIIDGNLPVAEIAKKIIHLTTSPNK